MNRLARLLGLGNSSHAGSRLRLGAYAVGANVLSKAGAFAVLILSTRVVLSTLGTERFGIWTTVSSIAVLLSFFDLGVPNALVSQVAASGARPNTDGLRKLLSRALAVLALLGSALAVALALATAVLPLAAVFPGASTSALNEARETLLVFAGLFGLSLLSQGVLKVYAGLQLGWIANMATAAGWCVSAILVLLGPRFEASMPYYLVATYGVQQFAGTALLVGLVRRRLFSLRNMRAEAGTRWNDSALFKQGNMFFAMQVSVAIVWGSNQLVLSTIGGPASAAEFSLLQRLFMCVQIGLAILNAPLWAMYADAHARHEPLFVRSLLIKAFSGTALAAIIGCSILYLWHDPLLAYVFTDKANVSNSSAALMAVWTILETCGNSYAMYLNGVGAIRPQMITSIAYVIAALPMKIFAAQHWGIAGLITAMIASYVGFTVLPLLTFLRRECLEALDPVDRA